MKKVALILNPNAGKRKMVDSIDAIKEKLQEGFEEVEVMVTKEKGDGAKLVSDLEGKVDLIIGAGGDGTIYELINAICSLKDRPAFAIIPGGTCNDFSRTIGMKQNPLLAVEQILEKRMEQVDVGKCDKQYFLNFWGIGLISKVSDNMDTQNKQLLGKLSYYISAGQTIMESEPFQLKVKSDTTDYDGPAMMFLIGNGSYVGGFQSFFPESHVQDGVLDVLIVKQTSLTHLWTWMQSKIQQQFPAEADESLIYFQAREIEIEATPKQEIDCDGECNFSTPSKIKILPKHLKVLVGDFESIK
ncbi:YegS/Rv2252/BmrU family lipid kinase [Bacillus tianshenii]|uniref:diacylglycerol/lipid kinase family protein n=1 Tax=Sutcliffiella tianshenii TaxID=1463404 RepID=UPI001CD20F62|nr:YegS/Rv2252/BmrU family lipid kinase [Bacillus tianshenii]MCA1318672.1 YegS/Rv2252/BmrU family lipid kinase [Bacillus tianshenii]